MGAKVDALVVYGAMHQSVVALACRFTVKGLPCAMRKSSATRMVEVLVKSILEITREQALSHELGLN